MKKGVDISRGSTENQCFRSNNKTFEGHKNYECYKSKKIKESNFVI